MNLTIWTGVLLIVLGLGGVFATGAATAAIPALFGLLLVLVGMRVRRPELVRSAGWPAAAVAVLGLLAPLGNLARVFAEGAFALNTAVFSNLTMAAICGAYLARWLYELWAERRGRVLE